MPKALNTTTNRRSFLAGLSLAAMMPASAIAAPAATDARLVEIARQIGVLRDRECLLSDECSRTYEIAKAAKPEKPRELLWRIGDPVGPTNFDPIRIEGSSSSYRWADPQQIRDLAKGPVTLPDFLSKKAHQAAKLRVEQLIELQLKYDRAVDEAYDRSGYNEAEEQMNKAGADMIDLLNQMLEFQPSSMDGLSAMAQALIDTCWCGEISEENGSLADRAVAGILAGLTGKPNPFKAAA
jgi:hypothetical protein